MECTCEYEQKIEHQWDDYYERQQTTALKKKKKNRLQLHMKAWKIRSSQSVLRPLQAQSCEKHSKLIIKFRMMTKVVNLNIPATSEATSVARTKTEIEWVKNVLSHFCSFLLQWTYLEIATETGITTAATPSTRWPHVWKKRRSMTNICTQEIKIHHRCK